MSAALLDALLLAGGYNAIVVALGCAAFGLAAGSLGCFVLLRGRALVADAAAHATLPGVALAFILTALLGGDVRSLPLLLTGGAASASLGVLAVGALTRGGRLRDDAAMALVLSISFGLGVVLLSVVQSLPVGGQAGLKGFILGQAAGMSAFDAQLIGALALLAVLLLAALFRPLAVLCFDREFAAAVGLPVRLLDLALMGLMLAVTVAGLRAVGLVLVVGLMVIPAATARLATERLAVMVLLAGLLGAFAAWLGAGLSATLPGLPTGATIVLVACALFVLTLVFAPRRGVLAFAWRQAQLSLVTARDHALRTAFEARESEAPGQLAAWAELGRGAGWSAWQRALLPWWVRQAGLATTEAAGGVALTPAGLALARDLTRRHRLWEHYLQSAGGLPPGTAHHAADEVEHTLPPEVAREAEAWLRRHDPDRLGPVDGLPPPGETGMKRP
ncbi:manganese ABC transporter permease [Siccirubricoccus deserti]|uniref:Metal ABC transporter permease n=1 Tax=Siccirubricoccus deserti TaxID=2013562 RepID=A0A9X0R2W0_9PROT|nr:metal ABC transporter permease [Siccirubricoccus deserti]MBC4018571.1 metal ABC transporter permease [Siccirubricoccus deserti]GGC67050.1 manganese ABC transporter permease [Siccirubricoccus deserti]